MSRANKKFIRPMMFAATSAMLLGGTYVGARSSALLKNNAKLEATAGPGYSSDYASKADAKAAGLELNARICEEGMVLLKNEDNALPLETKAGTDAKRISVFGAASVSPDGGGGDKADGSAGTVKVMADLYSSLRDAGYDTNPVVEKEYLSWKDKKMTTDRAISDSFNSKKAQLEKSFATYSDAAVVMLKNGTAPTIPTVSKTNPLFEGATTFRGNQVTFKLVPTRDASNTPNAGKCKLTSNYDFLNKEGTYTLEGTTFKVTLGDKTYTAEYNATDESYKLDIQVAAQETLDVTLMWYTKKLDSFPKNDMDHNLQFDVTQYELVDYVTSKFDNVILLINNSKPVELSRFKANDKVKAIMVVGNPGDNGFEAVGKILNGSVNPSGRTVDTYATKFKEAPSYNNYSANLNNSYSKYIVDGKATSTYLAEYEEGIYVGYRYYETRDFEEREANPSSKWYEENVTYPFGYGLSYTSFKQEIVNKEAKFDKNGNLRIKVKVTNEGAVAGKEVVQLYTQTPYKDGEIEKAHVVLSDFTKTKLLQPKESEIVEVKVSKRDIASYDYNDANKNSFKGYELDAGSYSFHIQGNSHDVIESIKLTLEAEQFKDSAATGNEVKNRFDDVSTGADSLFDSKLSRATITTKTTTASKDQKITAEEYKKWAPVIDAKYDEDTRWHVEEMPKYAKSESDRPEKAKITLPQLYGEPLESKKWDALVSQLTIDEMERLIYNGNFQSIALDYIDKPYVKDTDGPKGWSGRGTAGSKLNMFAAEPVIASTWNKDLAYEMGKMIGDQGLWGNSDIDYTKGDKIYGYTGWYAPAMNLHRSPFDTRYTEYYSEDGLLSGQMAANASLGAKSKGAYVFIKHFALHDDGGGVFKSYRGADDPHSGLSVWADEQTMREVYFSPFQIAVEEGKATACMSAFNRIGTTWAGGSYELLTELLRDEWGFKGMVVTDLAMYGYLNADQMIRAGGDFVLKASASPKLFSTEYTKSLPATQVAQMQRATKQILYTVLNSNAMQVPKGAAVYFENGEIPTATKGKAYEASFIASLNTMYNYSDISFELDSGELPEGLEFANGKISGTPTKAGKYTFTVLALADGYATAKKTVTLVVEDEKVAPGPSIDEGTKEDIDSMKTELEETKTELDNTKAALAGTKSLVITSLVVAIIGAVAAVASLVLGFFKKKN